MYWALGVTIGIQYNLFQRNTYFHFFFPLDRFQVSMNDIHLIMFKPSINIFSLFSNVFLYYTVTEVRKIIHIFIEHFYRRKI